MKIFKKLLSSLLIAGCLLFPFQPSVVQDSFFHNTTITIQSVAHAAGLTPDLLNEDFIDCTSWTDNDFDTGVSEIESGQLRLDTDLGAAGNAYASRGKTIANPPNLFTVEIKIYFDALGTIANTDYVNIVYYGATWQLALRFATDGLFIRKAAGVYAEVGADIVSSGDSVFHIYRFLVDKTVESTATVEVFLDNVSQGTVDCDYETGGSAGFIFFTQRGNTTDNMVSHIDYARIATGLGAINDTANPVVNIF